MSLCDTIASADLEGIMDLLKGRRLVLCNMDVCSKSEFKGSLRMIKLAVVYMLSLIMRELYE